MRTGRIRHTFHDWECDSRFIDRNCDICGKYCNAIYAVTEEAEFIIPAKKDREEYRGWTMNKTTSKVGHKDCLLRYSKEVGIHDNPELLEVN